MVIQLRCDKMRMEGGLDARQWTESSVLDISVCVCVCVNESVTVICALCELREGRGW